MKRPNKKQYDLAGYCIRYNVWYGNNYISDYDCYKFNDGKLVPLLFDDRTHNYMNKDENVIGYAKLKCNNKGVYCYMTLNNSRKGLAITKELSKDKDQFRIGIFIDNLKTEIVDGTDINSRRLGDSIMSPTMMVKDGTIRYVSLMNRDDVFEKIHYCYL